MHTCLVGMGGLSFDLRLNLFPFFMYASSKCCDNMADVQADPSLHCLHMCLVPKYIFLAGPQIRMRN